MFRAPSPMLAQLEHRLPRGPRWRYEPKLDGFRGLLWHRSTGDVHLLSRNLRDLAPWFPELVRAGQILPPGTLLDGEIVIANEHGHSDFGALQKRLVTTRRAAVRSGKECPAVLLVFDVIELGGVTMTDRLLHERRQLLEDLVNAHEHPCVQLVDQTDDLAVAEQWLALLPSLEGVVAKGADGRYVSGRREWVKVKRQRTADCVVIGVAGNDSAPSLVLGLRHADGQLHHFGVTRPSRTVLNEPCDYPAIRRRRRGSLPAIAHA